MVEASFASANSVPKNKPYFTLQLRTNMESNVWGGKDINSHNGKHIYKYSERKSDTEKTPMCRIAELARYNKLKHEYILLDESGPAHKKRFTVKLILCPGEEFEGQGASIKKAQQSAADVALQKTTLSRPQQKPKKLKKDSSNPIVLLKTVAARLDLEVHYLDESSVNILPLYNNNFAVNPSPLCLPIQSPSQIYPPNGFGLQTRPPLFPNPIYSNGAPPPPFPHLNVQAPFIPGIPPPVFNIRSDTKNINKYVINAPLSFHRLRMTPPPPPPLPFVSVSMPNQTNSQPQQQNYAQINTKNTTTTTYKFVVKLSDGTQHIGTGAHKQAARMNAATHALFHLRPALVDLENKISKEKALDKEQQNEKISTVIDLLEESESETESDNDDDNNVKNYTNDKATPSESTTTSEVTSEPPKRKKTKSVVSQVHECALRMKMNVEFEILMESGEPHNRVYLMRCNLTSNNQSIIADGEGPSKKAAKQDACKKLLEKIRGIENDPLYLASIIVKSSKKNTFGNVKDVKRKTIVKDMKLNPQYGQHINPISRLIQVMQIRKEEPAFRLIGEHGQNRSREFTFEVICQGIRKEGTGPNKKLAKRAAAEAMLTEIGYVKPMPQPGKSLLKKKSMSSEITSPPALSQPKAVMEIGVFNPSEVFSFALSENDKDTEETDGSLSDRIHGLSLETFADVENSFKEPSPSPVVSEETYEKTNTNNDDSDVQPISTTKRRVTFSNEVAACPPDDSTQTPLIAPLKSEVVLVNKLKKRGKDSKKYLSLEERRLIANLSRLFRSYTFAEERKSGLVPAEEKYYSIEFLMHLLQLPRTESTALVVQSAKDYLEKLAKTYKFTVVYSDFPKAQTDGESQYFSLVTLGFEKPIVCPGCGKSEEAAHTEAAFNAISSLSTLDVEVTGESTL